MLHLIGILLPPMVVGPHTIMRWLIPCNSATFAHQFIPECRNFTFGAQWTTLSHIFLLIICLLNYWLVSDAAGTFALYFVNIAMIQVHCMCRYIQYLTYLFTSQPENSQQNLLLYGQIQILGRYYNLIQQDGLMYANLFVMMAGLTLTSYTVISLGASISFPETCLCS